MPEVSVLMSAYNAEHHIAESIRSLLSQSMESFELLIVDDASTDSTAEIVRSFQDPRIHLIQNAVNLGLPPSLNRALQCAEAPRVARLDADDLAKPDRLQTQLAYLKSHPRTALIGSSAEVIDSRSRVIGHWEVPVDEMEIKWALHFSNPIVHSSVMFRKEAVEAVGGYPEDPRYRFVEDYFLWSELACENQLANLSEPLVSWREHDQSISRRKPELQGQQRSSVSERNLRRTLGVENLPADDLAAAYDAVLGPPRAKPEISVERISQGLLFLERLQNAFHVKFPRSQARHHQFRLRKSWIRHVLALALKPGSGVPLNVRPQMLFLASLMAWQLRTPGNP